LIEFSKSQYVFHIGSNKRNWGSEVRKQFLNCFGTTQGLWHQSFMLKLIIIIK